LPAIATAAKSSITLALRATELPAIEAVATVIAIKEALIPPPSFVGYVVRQFDEISSKKSNSMAQPNRDQS
jgi:hypothetical protein